MFFRFWVAVCSWNRRIVSPILLNELFTWIKIVGHLESCLKKEPRLGIWITILIPPPWPPMRQKKIHCQEDDWERLLSALVMGCDYHVLRAAFPFPISRCLSVWKHQPLPSSPWRQLQLPRAEGPREAAAAFPLTSDWLQCSPSRGINSVYKTDVCIGYTLRSLAWESHKAVFTQASPLLNPFIAPEAFHNEQSSKATLNLLKQNLFIRKLGWRSEIIIIGGYLQQEDEKEWYTVVVSGMYFIASHQNTADKEKNWHFHARVYFMLQCDQHMHFPTVKTILGFPFNTQKWRGRRTAWET